jgi:hypothetical protein
MSFVIVWLTYNKSVPEERKLEVTWENTTRFFRGA